MRAAQPWTVCATSGTARELARSRRRAPWRSAFRRSGPRRTGPVFRPRSQIFGPFPYAAETEEKIVALSFDDGPNEPYTTQLLNTLDRYDVKATFFQVGRCAQRFPSSTRRVVESGHVLGNHSYSHSFTRYLKEPRQEIEISRSQEVFYSITGLTPALYRPPWLCHWPWVLGSVRQHGLQVVSGTFAHPLEIFQPAAAKLADSAVRLRARARS